VPDGGITQLCTLNWRTRLVYKQQLCCRQICCWLLSKTCWPSRLMFTATNLFKWLLSQLLKRCLFLEVFVRGAYYQRCSLWEHCAHVRTGQWSHWEGRRCFCDTKICLNSSRLRNICKFASWSLLAPMQKISTISDKHASLMTPTVKERVGHCRISQTLKRFITKTAF